MNQIERWQTFPCVISTGVLLLFSKAKQHFPEFRSFIYLFFSICLFICVCLCMLWKLIELPCVCRRTEKWRCCEWELFVRANAVSRPTQPDSCHSFPFCRLEECSTEGMIKERLLRPWMKGNLLSGDQTNDKKPIQQTQSKTWHHKNYKKKVNMFSVKHGLMENQCKFDKNVIEWDDILNIQYCMILQMTFLFCWHQADNSSRPTTCHLINSWRTAQHYWISRFTC